MNRIFLLNILLLLLCLGTYSFAQCGTHCGTERWAVKTLSDSTVSRVKFTPKRKTVHWLVNATPPTGAKPDATRINALEWINFRVKAILVGYKIESGSHGDHDLHVVIQDRATDETMIVEFPDSACDGVCSSQYKADINNARASFLASPSVTERGTATSSFKRLNKKVIVEVIGVGFWDFKHGQTGLAKNAIELHPVIWFRELPQ